MSQTSKLEFCKPSARDADNDNINGAPFCCLLWSYIMAM